MFQADGTGNLEVGEAIDLGSVQQRSDLRRCQILLELARLHKLGDLREERVFAELLVDIDDVLQLLQEPAVDLRQLMELFNGIADLQGLRHHEDTHIRRFVEGGGDVGNLDLVVLHEAMHTLPDHTEALLQGFFKGTSDGHHLAHALHRRTELTLHTVELCQIPTGNLTHHVVEGGLEEGAGGLRDRVLQFKQAIAESQFGSHES